MKIKFLQFVLLFICWSGGIKFLQSQDIIPTSDEIILPQYIVKVDKSEKRCQYMCRLRLSGLQSNSTYRYYTGASTNNAVSSGNSIPGNFYNLTATSINGGRITGYTSAKGMGGALLEGDSFLTSSGSRYGEFQTDASGNYTGYFAVVSTGNAVFTAGNDVYFYIFVNDGNNGTSVDKRYRTTSTIKVLKAGTDNSTGSLDASVVYGKSNASPETLVFLYDDTSGSGRPLYGTWVEDDGIATTFTSWYEPLVDGDSGSWGGWIPNENSKGLRRVENRNWNGGIIAYNTDLDGIWPSGSNTVNPSSDTSGILISISDAPLNSKSQNKTAVISFLTKQISGIEGTTGLLLIASLTNAVDSNCYVDLTITGGTATPNTDYTISNMQFQILSGNMSDSILIDINDDSSTEGDETALFALRNVSTSLVSIGTDSNAVLTVFDNDLPRIKFINPNISKLESGDTIWIEAGISNPSTVLSTKVSVGVTGGSATLGTDYQSLSGNEFVFPANSSSNEKVYIVLNDDLIDENDETIELKLFNPNPKAQLEDSVLIITIIDNDGSSQLPEISFQKSLDSVIEGSSAQIQIIISDTTPVAVTVDLDIYGGSAQKDSNYIYTKQTITFPAGSYASQIINFSTKSDLVIKGPYTVWFRLKDVSSGAKISLNDSFLMVITEDNKTHSGLRNLEKQNRVTIYPNPVKKGEIVSIVQEYINYYYMLVDMKGAIVLNGKVNSECDLSLLSELKPGIYSFQITNGIEIIMNRIVVY